MKQLILSEIKEGETADCFRVYVRCYGVRRRARSNQHHRFDIGYFINPTKDDLEGRVKDVVIEHMKRLVNPTVDLVIQQHQIKMSRGMKIEKSSSDWIYGAKVFKIDVGGLFNE